MDIWNVDKLTLFLVFVLPGFISIKVYDLMVPGERRDFSKSLLEAISYSTLNFGALFWLIALIRRDGFYRGHFILYSLSVAHDNGRHSRLLAASLSQTFDVAAHCQASRASDTETLGLRVREAGTVLDNRSSSEWAKNRRMVRHRVLRILRSGG